MTQEKATQLIDEAMPANEPTANLCCTKQPTNWINAISRLKKRFQVDVDTVKQRYKSQRGGVEMSTPNVLFHDIGLQMMLAVRLMQLFRERNQNTVAKIISRAVLRHMYAADIHPDADLEPGVSIIHGNGIVIGRDVTVGTGSIIFHNVTLGDGRNNTTGAVGFPKIGDNVSIGPGSQLFGPISVGNNCKLAAGTVLDISLPSGSRARPAKPIIMKRVKKEE
ncbi:MAG: hypothetical protein JXR76_29500 [Deltaproteobacteria bacterium]|nr:hypothetical protein [Deltaproteobacteria bacterium]